MIFFSLNQLNSFLIFLFIGVVLGIIFCVLKIIFLFNFRKKLLKNIYFCMFFTLFFNIFIIFLNIFNFGKFNFVLLFSYISGFVLLEKVANKSVVFFENKWYTIITKYKQFKRNSNANKSKKS